MRFNIIFILFISGFIFTLPNCNLVLDEINKPDTTQKTMVFGTPAAKPNDVDIKNHTRGSKLKIRKYVYHKDGMTYYVYKFKNKEIEIINYTKDSLQVELLKRKLRTKRK